MSGRWEDLSNMAGNTLEARQRQMEGLKKTKGRPSTKRAKVELQAANIIEFAKQWLYVRFDERPAQEVVLRCLYGLPLDAEQSVLHAELTRNMGRYEPGKEKTEADLAVGARGGKSYLASIIALYEATRDKWKKYLNPKEIGYAVITATRQKQAEAIIQKNCLYLLENSRLKSLIGEPLMASLMLKNGMCIASFPCNSTAARGLPIFLLIFDEIAFYREEGPKADHEIHNALRPRQAQFPGAKCLKITTVAGKQGLFWDEFSQGFNVPGRLTVQATTRLMNPTIPKEFIDKEYKRDPDNAAREFGSVFAETVSGFFASCIEQLKDCFSEPFEDMPYRVGHDYYAAIDQSGLSGLDKFGFAIAHKDRRFDRIIVDVVREWETKNADLILEEIRQTCGIYHTKDIVIDKYASGWVENALNKRGLVVFDSERLPVAYTNFKTLVLADRLTMPDHPSLKDGLMKTNAYYTKSNNVTIGHERNRFGHGDLADAVVRAVYSASRAQEYGYYQPSEPAVAYIDQRYDRLRVGIKKGA